MFFLIGNLPINLVVHSTIFKSGKKLCARFSFFSFFSAQIKLVKVQVVNHLKAEIRNNRNSIFKKSKNCLSVQRYWSKYFRFPDKNGLK